jgi:serine/tyrosine/threonine adenylyltransferase
MGLSFDNTYARLPQRFFAEVHPTPVARPVLLAANGALAELLGTSASELSAPEWIETLAGNRIPEGAHPIALAYAGHQFGSFVPQLGDGRAILLGEVVGKDGRRYDIQLKGSGRTPFSRGGDGRAAVGPVLREYVVSEAMAALGVPTTRSLAAVATGERVFRESTLPGAVLTRVASSHLRVGTFQYFAARRDGEAVGELTRYALARHYPDAPQGDGPALALLDAVVDAQARLVARWLALGFVHGVMNTDNTSIAGETIDYGPCAFLDAFDPDRSFSSIDHGGRYAFSNQPTIAFWNVARLSETLLSLVHEDRERAVASCLERVSAFPSRFQAAYESEMQRKLGLATRQEGDDELVASLLELMAGSRADYTHTFRRLCDAAAAEDDGALSRLFPDPSPVHDWTKRWRARLDQEETPKDERAALMRRSNPAFIPRNHRVEEMITAATRGDMAPFERLCRVLARPYDDQPADADLADAPGEEQWEYRTFCGTLPRSGDGSHRAAFAARGPSRFRNVSGKRRFNVAIPLASRWGKT